jgi:phosphoglycerate kinase
MRKPIVNKKGLRDIQVAGKRVITRVDFNVPLDSSGAITDDSRIRASLPTIQYLKDSGAKTVICSHLGRPDGKVVEKLRMRPVADRLSLLLGVPVQTVRDCVGLEVERAVQSLNAGDILMLENLRFHPEEEKNDPGFARALAALADIFVNDAFGTAHRAHASTVGIAHYIPAVAGFLMQRELEVMGQVLTSPSRPFATLVGGAKVKDKLGLLENIVDKVDYLIIGGGMVMTFLEVSGYRVSGAGVGEGNTAAVKRIMDKAGERGVVVLLPDDVVVAKMPEAVDTAKEVPVNKIPSGWSIVDIGSRAVEQFSSELAKCKTVVWNGPMGIFEIPDFSRGTEAIARAMASLKATTVIGGGSTAEVVGKLGLSDRMTHVSTGGGASLMFLEGKELPGVSVLLDK